MEFNLSTFILEIINFLVLLWILQRLFYRPVLAVIAKRKQAIDDTLANAKQLHQEAENLRNLYENREKLWEQEKKTAVVALQQQLESERSSQLQKLRAELEQERQKAQVSLARQQQDFQQQVTKQALINGGRFAGLLLQQAVTPELETRLFALLIEQLAQLPHSREFAPNLLLADKQTLLVKVSSVYPLSLMQQQQLEQKLATVVTKSMKFEYQQDANLLAGIRLDLGAWVLDANLNYELAGFAALAHDFA